MAIGAALLGSPCVIGVDVDEDALEVALNNCEQFEDPLPVSTSVVAESSVTVRKAVGLIKSGSYACPSSAFTLGESGALNQLCT